MSEESFQKSVNRILDEIERFYANVPGDPGGETVWGISRVYWPAWEGWAYFDGFRNQIGFPMSLEHDQKLRGMAIRFYRHTFWEPIHGDELPDNVAWRMFETAVNLGSGEAVRILQIALKVRAHPLVPDATFGPLTAMALASEDSNRIDELLEMGQACMYRGIVRETPTKRKFWNGWLARSLA